MVDHRLGAKFRTERRALTTSSETSEPPLLGILSGTVEGERAVVRGFGTALVIHGQASTGERTAVFTQHPPTHSERLAHHPKDRSVGGDCEDYGREDSSAETSGDYARPSTRIHGPAVYGND